MASLGVGVDIPYFASAVEIRDFVQAVEELGYHHVGFSSHVCSTTDSAFPAPFFTFEEPWRESFTMAAFLAGVTSRLELNPSMVLLPLYPPVLAAKQAAEVDNLSGGRLRLAASIGWNERECQALGVDPATRGGRFEEQVEVMRRLWTDHDVTHHGRFFHLDVTGISPRPPRPIPVWFGAGDLPAGGFPSPRALERAARLADGFKFVAPTSLDQDRLDRAIAELRQHVAAQGRDGGSFGVEVRMVVQATPEAEWGAAVARAKRQDVTYLGVANRIAGGTVADQIELCRRFAETTRSDW
jgi:probable F420-dependent oxidoreductase